MNDVIRKIIEAGILAPSGGNSQPWKFLVRKQQLLIYNLPDKDLPFYNFQQRGSLVAHGALIENIFIAASSFGYQTKAIFFPDQNDANCVVLIEFKKSDLKADFLYNYLAVRATNRKAYQDTLLNEDQRAEILNSSYEIGNGEVALVDDSSLKKIIGEAVSINERLILENQDLHSDFFRHLVWTDKEERNKKSGLSLQTLELPLFVQFLFRLIKYWPVAQFLNKLGFSESAANENAKLYARTGAFGIITVPKDADLNFILAGRLMQRIWLKAAKMGLSFHPITGVLFVMMRIMAGESHDLPAYQINFIREAYEKILFVFNVKKGLPVILFRIGYGSEPSARSSRLPPEIIFEN